jgi:ATP-binding cassette subfamily B protein RaxB
LAQILLLSALLECLLLAQPLLLRAVVDVGIRQHHARFLVQAAGVLILAALLQGVIHFLRDWTVLRTGTGLNVSIGERIFHTTLRLPLAYFEKRPIGHLIERYRITDDVEQFMVGSLPLGLMDGLMAMISLGLVASMSPLSGALALATISVFFTVQWALFGQSRSRVQALQAAKREENGLLIETLTTIATTKANAIEQRRYQLWLHRMGCLVKEPPVPTMLRQKFFTRLSYGGHGRNGNVEGRESRKWRGLIAPVEAADFQHRVQAEVPGRG